VSGSLPVVSINEMVSAEVPPRARLQHVHGSTYQLHAIIVSRSPYLLHLMSTSPSVNGQRVVYVDLEDNPEVTQEVCFLHITALRYALTHDISIPMASPILGLRHRLVWLRLRAMPYVTISDSDCLGHAALGYLYSSVSLNHIRPDNARGVLAAGCLLGSLDDLCKFAYETCQRAITLDTIDEWLGFVESIQPSADSEGAHASRPSSTILGPYAQLLRADFFRFLVTTLSSSLDVHGETAVAPQDPSPAHPSGRETVLEVFSRVSFDLFKAAIESPDLQIGKNILAMPADPWARRPLLTFRSMHRIRSGTIQVRKGGD
jgi:hypothetical protein